MRKKIGLAIALIHRPQVLALDEALEAVDPLSAASIIALLRSFGVVQRPWKISVDSPAPSGPINP
jgi:ABC-type Mn2+/Zn2+ transport system ATPase subunit